MEPSNPEQAPEPERPLRAATAASSESGDATDQGRTEEALRDSEARYRALFDAIDEGFCIVEMLFDEHDKPVDYRFLEVNASFEKQTGLKDAPGKTMRQLEPDHEEHWFDIYGRVALTGEPVRFENRAERLHRWFEVYAFRFGQPESRRVAILFNDVTERKRAEQRLRRSEQELADFFENAPVALHWVGPDGTILRANQAELNLLGYARDEYVGRHIADFHVDEDVIDDIVRRLKATEELRDHGARLRCKDGSIRHVQISSNVLWENGEFIHTRCFTRDVTAQKEAEEASARLAAIVASSDDAIIAKNLDGVMTSWNDGARRVFGYTAKEAIGQPVTLLIPPDRLDEETDILRRIRRGERIQHYETVRRRKDGTSLDISLTISPIVDAQGNIVGASKIARDITDRRRAAEARRKQELEHLLNEQLTAERQRLGRELHDGLRQELVGIQMLSTSLYKKLEARAAPEAVLMREFSGLIGDANTQVRRLINGLVPVKVNADSLLPALERAAANIEQWYGLPCIVTCKQPIALRDNESANHLFHIAQEVMTNAAKHSRASQIDVSLKATGETLVLAVRDDGVGIPDDFDKRGGLGISSLRSRAALIGGCLAFKGDPGAGTVVSCSLPL